jgi:hypothetical protein
MSVTNFIALRFHAGVLTDVAHWAVSPTGPPMRPCILWRKVPDSFAEMILDAMKTEGGPTSGAGGEGSKEFKGETTFARIGRSWDEASIIALDVLTFADTLRKLGSWSLTNAGECPSRFFNALDQVRFDSNHSTHFVIDRLSLRRVLEEIEYKACFPRNERGPNIPATFFKRLGKELEEDRRAQRSREKVRLLRGGTHAVL